MRTYLVVCIIANVICNPTIINNLKIYKSIIVGSLQEYHYTVYCIL